MTVKHCIAEWSKTFFEKIKPSSGWTVLTTALCCVREIRYQLSEHNSNFSVIGAMWLDQCSVWATDQMIEESEFNSQY